jgi:hypothetical protein
VQVVICVRVALFFTAVGFHYHGSYNAAAAAAAAAAGTTQSL